MCFTFITKEDKIIYNQCLSRKLYAKLLENKKRDYYEMSTLWFHGCESPGDYRSRDQAQEKERLVLDFCGLVLGATPLDISHVA